MCAMGAREAMQRANDIHSSHQCSNCGKVYMRRDLRDRHKRRCIHTFTKSKRSKRRSCIACVLSKLGCEQEQPSCRRCSNRNIFCDYVGDTTNNVIRGNGDISPQAATFELLGGQVANGDDANSPAYGTTESEVVTQF
ncbi:hypothetical protein P153DRAFT_390372 [Dothidotthia symphoricarpi CBS 119687]|uniref:Zn(2)-C6 fungal-type domain-containing protein n=1 Tax=Dothidotthia symphoricarpi CBS 119687 TaxID=1392245 RepID=A0A6A6A052_9PLEO|nr:uncharacterized protein P153DRAFT_390372 [Dothidotthia symphoricarpi CBS 119687]KAF2124337.1 hypothetical protein P153DRAFT_390372 [Dothidotthia symphoricarpi CBS 119687]